MLNPPRSPARPLRRGHRAHGWHRWLGLIVGPWLVLMAASGLALACWPDSAVALDPATGLRAARPGAAVHDWISDLHAALAWPPAGAWIVLGLGLLALVSLALGARLGWPRRWRDTLLPARTAAARARWFGWHRAGGWWVLALLLPMLVSGALLAASVVLPLDGPSPVLPVASSGVPPHAGVVLWAVSETERLAPKERLHRVRVHDGLVEVITRSRWGLSAGQDRRWWFDVGQQRLLRQDAPESAPALETGLGALFAFHSGQWAGPGSVLIVGLAAFGLAAVTASGWRLWWLRRGKA